MGQHRLRKIPIRTVHFPARLVAADRRSGAASLGLLLRMVMRRLMLLLLRLLLLLPLIGRRGTVLHILGSRGPFSRSKSKISGCQQQLLTWHVLRGRSAIEPGILRVHQATFVVDRSKSDSTNSERRKGGRISVRDVRHFVL